MVSIKVRRVNKPESAGQSFAKVMLSVVSLVLTVYITYTYKKSCGNDWLYAVLKALGINCLSMVLLSAIIWPMMYWDRTSQDRGVKGPTIPGKIAKVMAPWTTSGWVMQIMLVVVLFMIFVRDCTMTSTLGYSPMTVSPTTMDTTMGSEESVTFS
jgi:hypothetical protein